MFFPFSIENFKSPRNFMVERERERGGEGERERGGGVV